MESAQSTLDRKFGDVFQSGCLAEDLLMRMDLDEERSQVVATEFPLKRASGRAVVVPEAQQVIPDFGQGPEVAGCEHLTLNDREVHLDLIQSASVHGRMHRDNRGPVSLQSLYACLAAVRGAVVHDPKYPPVGSRGTGYLVFFLLGSLRSFKYQVDRNARLYVPRT
jgi:hypothetical protein